MSDSAITSATLNYTFGAVTITITADGQNIDRPTETVDHMLSTAATIAGVEIVNSGVSRKKRDDNSASTHEKFIAPIAFGDGIALTIEVGFDLAGHVSKRTLNSIVFGGILPKTIQTAGIYFGDNQTQTSPPSPLPSRSRREVYDNVDEALALMTRESNLPTNGSRSESLQTDATSSR